MNTDRGRLIVFEGIDGCGKDTQIEILEKKLELANIDYFTHHEPTSGPIGSLIHDAMTEKVKIDPRVFGLLFAADRYDHLISDKFGYGIMDTINKGFWYIESRWYLSSIAYQSVDLTDEYIKNLNDFCPKTTHADMTIYIDISPEEAVRRLKNGHNGEVKPELFEKDLMRLQKTHDNYDKIIREHLVDENILIVNGELDINEIADQIWTEVLKMI